MINLTVKLTKAAIKNNVSGSISYNEDGSVRTYNLTGRLIELENFISRDGKDLSKDLVGLDVPTTILFNEVQGQAVLEKCADIFKQRALSNDINPAIDLELSVKTLRPRESNILVVNVVKVFVNPDTQISDSSDTILSNISKLKLLSNSNSKNLQNSIALQSANIANSPNSPSILSKLTDFVKTKF